MTAAPRIIVARVERTGYQCFAPACRGFHRPEDAEYQAHLRHASEGPTWWVETYCWVVEADGTAVPMPSAFGDAALRQAKE